MSGARCPSRVSSPRAGSQFLRTVPNPAEPKRKAEHVEFMDQEESLPEYVVERRQCCGGVGTWPDDRPSKAPNAFTLGRRHTPDDQVLDRPAHREAKTKPEEVSLAPMEGAEDLHANEHYAPSAHCHWVRTSRTRTGPKTFFSKVLAAEPWLR